MGMIGIKDFELPKSCYDCPLDYDLQNCSLSISAYGDDYDFCNERSPRCPLVEIEEQKE